MDVRAEFPGGTAPEIVGFCSLSDASEYVDGLFKNGLPLGSAEVVNAVTQVRRAYREFPELEAARPRAEIFELLWPVARKAAGDAAPVVIELAQFAPTAFLASLGGETDETGDPLLLQFVKALPLCCRLQTRAMLDVVTDLVKSGRNELALALLSLTLGQSDREPEAAVEHVGVLLVRLLQVPCDDAPESAALAKAAQAAIRRFGPPQTRGDERGGRERLLSLAARLTPAVRPRRPSSPGSTSWPSGPLPFDDFLLQWPCEIELPDDLGDGDFLVAAYKAILLRPPLAGEREQWLRLLQRGDIPHLRVIEELLTSPELRAIGRRVRVRWRGRVVIDPDAPETADMPAVTWSVRWPGSDAE